MSNTTTTAAVDNPASAGQEEEDTQPQQPPAATTVVPSSSTSPAVVSSTGAGGGGGIEWPIDENTGKKPSTTSVNKHVWISVLSSLTSRYITNTNTNTEDIPAYVQEAIEIQTKLTNLPNTEWRYGYIPYLVDITRIQCMASGEECIDMCRAGLTSIGNTMVCRGVTASEAILEGKKRGGEEWQEYHFESLIIRGDNSDDGGGEKETKNKKRYTMEVPSSSSSSFDNNNNNGLTTLSGKDLESQLNTWSEYGCIEPTATKSATEIVSLDDTSHLIKDQVYVLLGATSELGPYKILMDSGATIVAVARKGKKLQGLIEEARVQMKNDGGSNASASTIIVPVRRDGPQPPSSSSTEEDVIEVEGDTTQEEAAGADLIEDGPELARYIASLYPSKRLIICNLAYVDGERNVRASVGMDLISQYVCSTRRRPNSSSQTTALAFLISPATPHVITSEAANDAEYRYEEQPWSLRMMPGVRKSSITEPLPNNNLRLLNGLSSVQGPNYALSKTIQQWRAIVSSSEGYDVSANVAPAARTYNMISHSKIGVALEGMQNFVPFVAFHPSTARGIMTSLLLWDLYYGVDGRRRTNKKEDDETSDNNHLKQEQEEQQEQQQQPSRKQKQHPMCLFQLNAVHGGTWRCPFNLSDMGIISYLSGKFFVTQPGLVPHDSIAPCLRRRNDDKVGGGGDTGGTVGEEGG